MASCTVDDFFNRDKVDDFHEKLNPLLFSVFQAKSSVQFVIDYKTNSVSWLASKQPANNSSITVSGAIPQGVAKQRLGSVGNNVLLPFLLAISKVEIPYNKLYFLGRNDKCMAEFLLRNFATNLAVKSHFVVELDRDAVWGSMLYRRLIERYLWYFKDYFLSKESISSFSMEKLLTACFLNIKDFDENPTLCADLSAVREILSPSQVSLVDQLLIVRDEVMHQCYS